MDSRFVSEKSSSARSIMINKVHSHVNVSKLRPWISMEMSQYKLYQTTVFPLPNLKSRHWSERYDPNHRSRQLAHISVSFFISQFYKFHVFLSNRRKLLNKSMITLFDLRTKSPYFYALLCTSRMSPCFKGLDFPLWSLQTFEEIYDMQFNFWAVNLFLFDPTFRTAMHCPSSVQVLNFFLLTLHSLKKIRLNRRTSWWRWC